MCKCLFFLSAFLLLAACKSPPPLVEVEAESVQELPTVPETVVVPQIHIEKPGLAITSITILQADLINTRFKIGLKIDNPNTFPITLSSFRYELYGDGNFWADGMEKNLGVVPPQSSLETSFIFEMNFINMRRRLLDDIIAMREVRYRVAGSVEVEAEANAPETSGFRMDFDYSGNSAVMK